MDSLIVFRHGIAVPHGTEGAEESQRPLTPKGERRTRRVAKALRPMLKGVERIISSPLPRAGRTAEIVAEVLGIPELLEVSDVLLPEAEPEAIKAFVEAREEARIMIVGHNPSLSDLITLLLTKRVQPGLFELRKAGAASLRKTPEGRYGLDWFARPRLTR